VHGPIIQFVSHMSVKLVHEDTEQQIIRETFHLVSKRDENVCNFLEGGMLIGGSENKLIYRHYATLYFVFCVDSSESELGILDLIQVFVETLDKCFENVCELDLIFHVDKMVMGGMVDAQNKMEKSEVRVAVIRSDFSYSGMCRHVHDGLLWNLNLHIVKRICGILILNNHTLMRCIAHPTLQAGYLVLTYL
uniref:AP complex mu/sigma subunit domain-containing protein n=1 Tax=Oncorhynchus tshawytscha TaxID=74940 RepID=A0AAZ3PDR4_ONCTS